MALLVDKKKEFKKSLVPVNQHGCRDVSRSHTEIQKGSPLSKGEMDILSPPPLKGPLSIDRRIKLSTTIEFSVSLILFSSVSMGNIGLWVLVKVLKV